MVSLQKKVLASFIRLQSSPLFAFPLLIRVLSIIRFIKSVIVFGFAYVFFNYKIKINIQTVLKMGDYPYFTNAG